jgi:hypothetical protein
MINIAQKEAMANSAMFPEIDNAHFMQLIKNLEKFSTNKQCEKDDRPDREELSK